MSSFNLDCSISLSRVELTDSGERDYISLCGPYSTAGLTMSESIIRKVQPFTIGTRLSVSGPATRSRGPNFPQQPSWQSDRVSLYLSQVQVSVATPHLAPLANRTTPTSVPVKQQQEDISTQDHRNQNTMSVSPNSHRSSVSPTATSRSIRKITISGSPEKEYSSWRKQVESDHRVVSIGPGPGRPPVTGNPGSENIIINNNNSNNNISSSKQQLPRIVGVSCENKPSSHFKVGDLSFNGTQHQWLLLCLMWLCH